MPIVREFVYRENEQTGAKGLEPVWFDNAEPFDGRVIAHDMLEHFRNQRSPIEGECEALGAAIALRLRYEDPVLKEPLKFDVHSILLDFLLGDFVAPACRQSRALKDDAIELLIRNGVSRGFELAQDEIDSMDCPQEKLHVLLQPSTQQAFIGLIRQGYRKALKRFQACDLYTVGHDVFELIEKNVNRLLSGEQLGPLESATYFRPVPDRP